MHQMAQFFYNIVLFFQQSQIRISYKMQLLFHCLLEHVFLKLKF